MCNNPQLYSNFINNLSSKIEEADYTISNPNTEILNQLSEEFLDSLNFNDICRVIYAILRGQQGYGREVKMLYANLANLHIFKLYTQDIFTKFDSSTLKELLAYHVSSENILYLVKILNNIDATFIDKFSSLVEEYMEEETDTWNQFVLENVLRAFPDRNYNGSVVKTKI